MNTDRELLELAAKAYFAQDVADGVCSFRWDEKEDAIFYIHADNQDHNGNDVELLWIPHADDGDALRLAVTLGIDIEFRKGEVWAYRHAFADGECFTATERLADHQPENCGTGCRATRLAIVRAAAHIGEAMP